MTRAAVRRAVAIRFDAAAVIAYRTFAARLVDDDVPADVAILMRELNADHLVAAKRQLLDRLRDVGPRVH